MQGRRQKDILDRLQSEAGYLQVTQEAAEEILRLRKALQDIDTAAAKGRDSFRQWVMGRVTEAFGPIGVRAAGIGRRELRPQG